MNGNTKRKLEKIARIAREGHKCQYCGGAITVIGGKVIGHSCREKRRRDLQERFNRVMDRRVR